jgi:hypothetical protein
MNCDKELLVGYLYGELSGGDRSAFERHLESCGECRAEVGVLRETRERLTSWTPPERELGFEIIRRPAAVVTPVRWVRPSPAWGLAAAAVLLLAVASAIANVEVRYDADGFALRTGWNRTAPASVASTPAVNGVSPVELQAIAKRIEELEANLSQRPSADAVRPVNASASSISDAELLRRVRQLLAESESRQQQELALRIRQVLTDVDASHRSDLTRLQQSINQLQGATDAEVLRQREMVNHIYRVVAQQR